MALIASATPTTGTVTFNSIPGVYGALLLLGLGRISPATTGDYVYGQFNNDAGSNYDEWRLVGATGGTAYAQTRARLAEWPGASAPSSAAGSLQMYIPGYATTTLHKTMTMQASARVNTSDLQVRHHAINWRSANAISRIDLTLASGNFVTGTVFYLYGLP